MHASHEDARVLFDATVDDYQRRALGSVRNFSSLIFQRRIDIVQAYLARLAPGAEVLDFGMGPAVFGPACIERGVRYTGIDIAPEMVARAREVVPGAQLLVGDLESLAPFRASKDLVMAIGLLDYLEEPEHGIRELAACVRPGGWLVLSFRNRRSVPRALRDTAKRAWRALAPRGSEADRRAFVSDVHEHSFDFEHDLAPILDKLHFGELEVEYFNCSPFFVNFPLPDPIWGYWRTLDARLARKATSPMCSGAVLAAKRLQ